MDTSLKPGTGNTQNGELMSNSLEIHKEMHPSLTFAGQESLGTEMSEKNMSHWGQLLAKEMWSGDVLMEWKDLEVSQT